MKNQPKTSYNTSAQCSTDIVYICNTVIIYTSGVRLDLEPEGVVHEASFRHWHTPREEQRQSVGWVGWVGREGMRVIQEVFHTL